MKERCLTILEKRRQWLVCFVIKGSVKVDEQELGLRDGAGITEFENVRFEATSDAELLLMEVPMV